MLPEVSSSVPWLSGISALLGSVVGAGGAVLTQVIVARLGRRRDRFQSIRNAYAEFGTFAIDFGSRTINMDVLVKEWKRLPEFPSGANAQEDRVKLLSRLENEQDSLMASYLQINGALNRLLLFEHNPSRLERLRKYHNDLRNVRGKVEYLKDVGKATDANFIVAQATNGLDDWLVEVGIQLRAEEGK